MTPLSRSLVAGALIALAAGGTAAAGEAGSRHGAWHACLDRNFRLERALTDRTLAAEAALRACRGAEDAYLAALSNSPLLDGEDAARARPALAARARARLLGMQPAAQRAALR